MEHHNKHYRAYQDANWFSKVFYLWLNPLFLASRRSPLTSEDIFKLSENKESDYVTKALERQWLLETRKRKPNLFFAILRTYKKGILLSGASTASEMALYTVRPLIMQKILLGFQDFSISEYRFDAILYSLLLILITFVSIFFRNFSFWVTYQCGMNIRVASSGLIYKKILRLNQKALMSTNPGHIINMLATDAQRFELSFIFLPYLWVGPLQSLVVLWLMTQITIIPSICAIVVMLLFIPVQSGLNRLYSSIRLKIARITDTRIRLLSDVINGIKIIKLHTWENLYAKFVADVRRRETHLFMHVRMCQAFQYTQLVYQVKLITLAMLLAIVLMHTGPGDPPALRSDNLFALLNYLGCLFISVTLFMPFSVQNLFDTLVSCSRIAKFLLLPEMDSDNQPVVVDDEVPRLCFNEASASWNEDHVTLKDISFSVTGPRLIAVVGSVGSGKSSLLQAALAELPLSQGSLERSKSIAYMPQIPWIFPGTLQENVICSLPMERDRYLAVLKATTLDVDIGRLPYGDQTQVGERGVSLSGGQKARICMARIAYARSQVVLLDDPLAAVDARVVNHLFDKCISDFLSDRLRILVTHQHHLLSRVDMILILKEGRLIHCGTYNDLTSKGINLSMLTYRRPSVPEDSGTPGGVLGWIPTRIMSRLQPTGEEELLTAGATDSLTVSSGLENSAWIVDDDDEVKPEGAVGAVIQQSSKDGHLSAVTSTSLVPDSSDLDWCHSLPDILENDKNVRRRQRAISSSEVFHSVDFVGRWNRTHQHFLSYRATKTPENDIARKQSSFGSSAGQPGSFRNTPRGSLTTGLAHNLENAAFSALQWQMTAELELEDDSCDVMDRLSEAEEDGENGSADRKLEGDEANLGLNGKKASNSGAGGGEEGAAGEQAEGWQTGSVKWSHYLLLGRMGGGLLGTFAALLLFVVTITNYAGCDVWLTKWSQIVDEKAKQNGSQGNVTSSISLAWDVRDNRMNLLFFGALTTSLVVISSTRSFVFFWVLINTAKRLHHRMLMACLFTRLRFFEVNTSGRILNRFAKDIGQVDDILPTTIHDFLQCFMLVIATGLVTIASSFWVAIPTIPLLILFYFARRYYLRTSRDLKRIESVARSPVYSWVNVTIQGLPCIRATLSSQYQLEKFNELTDNHSSVFFAIIGTARWLAIRLDLLCIAFIVFVVVTCLLMGAFSSVPSAEVGLMITYSTSLVSLFQWCVRQSAEMENQMVSVERAVEYVDLPPEDTDPPVISPPSIDWPEQGHICFNQLCLRYTNSASWALRDICLDIKPGSKVGIVGRTGAGKSTLISALFRLVEAESGSIVIDGVDIARLELSRLRKRMSIIPQDPILFSGTIRSNLDPDGLLSDEVMWSALASVCMRRIIANLANGLDAHISEGGSNFSTGERQLLALVRAILGGNRILVVDEATANVDPGTDIIIQKTLRVHFSQCTVITIAHRLHTVIDNDLIVVMEGGRIVETASPHMLLNPELAALDAKGQGEAQPWRSVAEGGSMDDWVTGQGALAGLVRQTGPTESRNLATIARTTFLNSRGDKNLNHL